MWLKSSFASPGSNKSSNSRRHTEEGLIVQTPILQGSEEYPRNVLSWNSLHLSSCWGVQSIPDSIRPRCPRIAGIYWLVGLHLNPQWAHTAFLGSQKSAYGGIKSVGMHLVPTSPAQSGTGGRKIIWGRSTHSVLPGAVSQGQPEWLVENELTLTNSHPHLVICCEAHVSESTSILK